MKPILALFALSVATLPMPAGAQNDILVDAERYFALGGYLEAYASARPVLIRYPNNVAAIYIVGKSACRIAAKQPEGRILLTRYVELAPRPKPDRLQNARIHLQSCRSIVSPWSPGSSGGSNGGFGITKVGGQGTASSGGKADVINPNDLKRGQKGSGKN